MGVFPFDLILSELVACWFGATQEAAAAAFTTSPSFTATFNIPWKFPDGLRICKST
jgi:hypothetical protein